MGKLNEVQEQVTQSYGSNSFTTKITDQTVEFDSAKDSFTFMDEVNVPALKVNGQTSEAFTAEEKEKLAKVTTPMNMKGRVDSVSDLPTENVAVGDTYLVGPAGSENFEEYVCTALEGSPETPVWENIGHIKAQPDWNQNNSNAEDFIKNRTHYVDSEFVQVDSESVEISEPLQFTGDIQSFTGEVVNEAQYTIQLDGVTYQAVGSTEYETAAIYYYNAETEATIGIQEAIPIGPKNENSEEQESKWIVECYGITLSTNNVQLVVTDSQQTVMVNETVTMVCDAYGEITFSEEISTDSTYKVTIDGTEYDATVVEEGKGGGEFYIVCDGVCKIGMGFISIFDIQYTNKTITLVINELQEVVHTLADKFLSDNIARVSSLPAQAFNIDETKYNIYPTFTNTTNEIKSTLQQSLIACAPAASNCVFDGGTNVFLGSAVYGNKISGSTNIGISSNSSMEVSGSGNIAVNSNGGANKVSGGANIMITSGAASVTVGGQSNTVISSYGGGCTISDNEIGSVLIGQCAGIKLQNGGYQKLALNPQYGSELNADHSTIICGGGKVNSVNSTIISNQNTSNNIYGANSLIIGGGQTGTANIGTSETGGSTTMCNIICSGSGNSTITSGAGNNIIGSFGGTFTVNGGTNNNIIGFNGSGTIQGGAYNILLGGSGSVTIPGTVSNCIVVGAATSSPTESNMVYVPALNAVNGVTTKKMTIAGIDPADVFMHSEIVDASSDVAFSRVIANTASTKTDGYVEILYKASSGVTCSAYIDSADVALTADGAWHKLEQGCNPANGVEIHINNSSPVTDATLEVISKVYYI